MEAVKYFSIDITSIRKLKLSVEMGRSRSDFELDDCPTLSDICKSDHGINSGLCYQLKLGEILEFEKNYVSDV